MTVPALEETLDQAYSSWAQTGQADVPDFAIENYDAGNLAARLAQLDAVSVRCVISRTKASWLRRAMGQ